MPPGRPWLERLAHDLRGPLSPIQTASWLLRDPALDPAQREELFAVLDRQVQRMGAMIDEFSDLLQIGDRLASDRRETVDLELLVHDSVAGLGTAPPVVEFHEGTRGLALEGDARRLAQLFDLLLGLRLSRRDPSPVRASIERREGGLRMTCTVPCPDATDSLASALLQAPHPDPPDEALGLGLLIAGAIARSHGGGLSARAGNDGNGLEIELALPLAAT